MAPRRRSCGVSCAPLALLLGACALALGVPAVPEEHKQFVERPSAAAARQGFANTPQEPTQLPDGVANSPGSPTTQSASPSARQAGDDGGIPQGMIGGEDFTFYPSCREEGLYGEMERIFAKAATPCTEKTGCPAGTCLARLGAGQMLFCEAPGRCIRYGLQPANNLGFITLEAMVLPAALDGTFICPVDDLQDNGERSCGVKYVDLEESACGGGMSVPNSGRFIHHGSCIALSNDTEAGGAQSNGSAGDAQSGDSRPTNGGSVTATADENKGKDSGGSCFPSDATVLLESGDRRAMHSLLVGDRVHIGKGEFSDVYGFSHRLGDKQARPFVDIRTITGRGVVLSPGHYIYVSGDMRPARSVRAGDHIMHAMDGTREKVVSVTIVSKAGLYNPHTLHGDIDVDGMLCSTFTEAFPFPVLAHSVLLAPFRLLYQAFGVPAARTLEGGSVVGEALRAFWMNFVTNFSSHFEL